MAAGELDRAEEIYRTLVEDSPRAVEPMSGLADLYVRRGQEQRALDLLVATSRRFLAAGRHDGTAELLRMALEIRPESPELHALRGRALALGERFREAESELARAVELGAGDVATLLYLASARWENGDPESAAVVFRQAVERYPGSSIALHRLGSLELWRGNYSEAVELLGRVVDRNPRAVDLLFDYARALDGAGRSEAAVKAYRRVLSLAPGHLKARYGLARQLVARGDTEEARRQLARYRELYRRDQENTRATGRMSTLLDRARNLIHRGEIGAALEVLGDLPETAAVLETRADAYLTRGDRRRAIESLERAVALAPERRDLQIRLHEVRLSGGWR